MEGKRDRYITKEVSRGSDLMGGSKIDRVRGAFFIGKGLHAVMDQYSPAHMGDNQHWSKGQFYKHGPFPTSLEGIRTAVQPQHSHIIDKLRATWSPK